MVPLPINVPGWVVPPERAEGIWNQDLMALDAADGCRYLCTFACLEVR